MSNENQETSIRIGDLIKKGTDRMRIVGSTDDGLRIIDTSGRVSFLSFAEFDCGWKVL
jgi:hypothetical protein